MEIQTQDFTADQNVAYRTNGGNVTLPPIMELDEEEQPIRLLYEGYSVYIKNIGSQSQTLSSSNNEDCDTETIEPGKSVLMVVCETGWYNFVN